MILGIAVIFWELVASLPAAKRRICGIKCVTKTLVQCIYSTKEVYLLSSNGALYTSPTVFSAVSS